VRRGSPCHRLPVPPKRRKGKVESGEETTPEQPVSTQEVRKMRMNSSRGIMRRRRV
jgi:hypothetical protein